MKTAPRLARLAALLLLAAAAPAQERYFDLDLGALDYEEGETPPAAFVAAALALRSTPAEPRAWIEGGEAYLALDMEGDPRSRARLVARLPEPGGARGVVLLPADGNRLAPHAFTLREQDALPAARAAFLRARYTHYEELRQRAIPGAAWFRHSSDEAARALRELGAEPPEVTLPWFERSAVPEGELGDTWSLFTGGRALSENLALERVVEPADAAGPSVPIAEIAGVQTLEMDWSARVEGLEPRLDPLARAVPADQHALFFPSFGALVDLVDEVRASGAPLLSLVEPRSESEDVLERYEAQLCLPLGELARTFGGVLVDSVAVTGSDPYLRTGTELAVLFEARQPEALLAFVRRLQQRALEERGADLVESTSGELTIHGADSGDWRVSSWAARIGDVVVVANTPQQLARVAATLAGDEPALAALPEYVFFRDRYPRGAEGESAFLVIGDATIRRWCGPRWRIGASRRLRAAALMAEAQAEHLAALVAGEVEPRVLEEALPVPGAGALVLEPRGVRSETYGTLAFLTPIARLELEHATEAEARGYAAFRAGYESNWRRVFDPIGGRVAISGGELALDLSVLPLVAGTDYGELVDLTGEVQLDPLAGDLHPQALFHAIYAVDHDTETFRRADQMLSVVGALSGTGLGWMGESVELYLEADALWEELERAEELDTFVEDHLYELPVALRVPVRDPLRLATFLTALRTTAGQAAPGLVRWENREHAGQPYVAILAEPAAGSLIDMEGLGLYYTPGPDALTLSLREDLVQRAIERRLARASGEAAPPDEAPRPWLGRSAAMRLERGAIALFSRLFADDLRREMQRRAWSNLPILDEWRRLFPGHDPLELHERLFGVRLLEPGGGRYAWNEALRTYESTLYGSPGAPLDGPPLPPAAATLRAAELGVSFEPLSDDGETALRARARVLR